MTRARPRRLGLTHSHSRVRLRPQRLFDPHPRGVRESRRRPPALVGLAAGRGERAPGEPAPEGALEDPRHEGGVPTVALKGIGKYANPGARST